MYKLLIILKDGVIFKEIVFLFIYKKKCQIYA
jgi:hypothetical protein